MRALYLGLTLFLLAASAVAQSKIYQVRMPDGSILFTDSPPRGAVIVNEREVTLPPAASPPPRTDAAEQKVQEAAAGVDQRMRERGARLDKAFEAVAQAEREVEQAKQRLEIGQEPQAGELLGKVGGGIRRGPAYDERIAGLEKAVTDAEARLAKAREELNALR